MNLSTMSLSQLKKLATRVEKAIATAEARKLQDARAAIEKLAKEYGVPVEDLLSAAEPKPKRPYKKRAKSSKPAVAKFRNPSKPSETWTGKGRRPKWYLEALANGNSETDLAA